MKFLRDFYEFLQDVYCALMHQKSMISVEFVRKGVNESGYDHRRYCQLCQNEEIVKQVLGYHHTHC